MKRSRFSEEQIIAILKEQEAGVPADLCRGHGISDATFRTWRNTYGVTLLPKLQLHPAVP
jgi:putative transposase